MRVIAEGDEDAVRDDVAEILAIVRERKDWYVGTMTPARNEGLAELCRQWPDRRERQSLGWDAFLAAGSEACAHAFADRVGLADASRARGLAGLLEVRAVRFAVGVGLSQVYHQLIGGPGHPTPRVPNRNDGYDLGHAILASAADACVTRDVRFADHLRHVPMDGFRVAASLRELLA